jgi:methionyl-tRNA formyltransferase
VSTLRVLFAGTPEVALPALELLATDPRFEVVAALTNPDRPRGRSGTPLPSPVARRALELGIPVLRPEKVADAGDALAATRADIGAVVAYGSILPPHVLTALPLGFVNLHFSLLPRWRGAAPVQHAVRNGDAVTGVTAFRLDAGMDTGPVLRTLEVVPPAHADAGDLLDDLATRGAPVLADAILAVAAGETGVAQPTVGATLAPRIRPEDAVVRWNLPAADVARMIRSVTPRPGAATMLDGERMKVAAPTVVDPGELPEIGRGPVAVPGEIRVADSAGIVVECGAGAVRIARVQMSGRSWTDAADQVRGRRLGAGMLLGGGESAS